MALSPMVVPLLSLVFAVSVASASESKPVVVPLQKYAGKLRSVPVAVAGATRAFLLDTGGGVTAITPDVADQVGCASRETVELRRMSGEILAATSCGEVELELGGTAMRTEVVVLDLMALLPRGAPPVGGVISLHTFRDWIALIDLGGQRVELHERSRRAAAVQGKHELAARFAGAAKPPYLDLFVGVRGRSRTLWLEVDSANLDAVLLSSSAMSDLDGRPLGEKLAGDAREVTLELERGGSLQVSARVADIVYDGVLNAATLERLVLVVDGQDRRAWVARK